MHTVKKWLALVLTTGLIGSACGTHQGASDGRDDPIAAAGKADSIFGDCQVRQALAYANDNSLSVEEFKSAGINERAAQTIVAHRNGPDNASGTTDDNPFDDLRELDEVPWVGPRSMEQLVAASAHRCQVSPVSEVIFSPQPIEQSHLVRIRELIDTAVKSIDVAVYSFSDSGILNALQAAVERGVAVRFVFETARADKGDPEGTWSAKLEDRGVDVRYINKIMHHKFMIVDGPQQELDDAFNGTLVTGSGNWSTSAATRYDENTMVLTGSGELLLRYQQEFNLMWDNSRDLIWNDQLAKVTTRRIENPVIADEPGEDAVFTSDNFTVKDSSNGPTFSLNHGQNAVSDKLVALIEQAQSSIWIASGHLRSRPVAMALMAKKAARPDMDIRVYLDSQEYTSKGYHEYEQRELQQCLEQAGDNLNKQDDCTNSGVHYGYAVQEAGITLKYKYYCFKWDYRWADQMHHKYLILDGQTLVTGSYNLSDNAEHNTLENMGIFQRSRHPELVDAYIDNFERIFKTGDSQGLYERLLAQAADGQEIPNVFEPMALTWDQVSHLRKVAGVD